MKKELKFTLDRVRMVVHGGEHVEDALKRAICLSALEFCEVGITMNGININVDIRDLIREKNQEYYAEFHKEI